MFLLKEILLIAGCLGVIIAYSPANLCLLEKMDLEQKNIEAERKIVALQEHLSFLQNDLQVYELRKVELLNERSQLKNAVITLQEEVQLLRKSDTDRSGKINESEVLSEQESLTLLREQVKLLKSVALETEIEKMELLRKNVEFEKEVVAVRSELKLLQQLLDEKSESTLENNPLSKQVSSEFDYSTELHRREEKNLDLLLYVPQLQKDFMKCKQSLDTCALTKSKTEKTTGSESDDDESNEMINVISVCLFIILLSIILCMIVALVVTRKKLTNNKAKEEHSLVPDEVPEPCITSVGQKAEATPDKDGFVGVELVVPNEDDLNRQLSQEAVVKLTSKTVEKEVDCIEMCEL